jgi:hypothetical protein
MLYVWGQGAPGRMVLTRCALQLHRPLVRILKRCSPKSLLYAVSNVVQCVHSCYFVLCLFLPDLTPVLDDHTQGQYAAPQR